MPDRLLNINDVCNKVSLSKYTIYRKIANDEFPKQVYVAKKAVRWKESAIDEWIKSLDNNPFN